MRRANLFVSTLFSACLLAVPIAFAERGNAEQQISALSDQLIQAQLKNDTTFFEKYYADDATIVHGNGKLYTKEEEIADLKSGSLKYESIEVRDKKVRLYGDAAVVNIRLYFKGLLAGQPFSGADLRRTVVWVKRKGSWNIVLYQVTRLEVSK